MFRRSSPLLCAALLPLATTPVAAQSASPLGPHQGATPHLARFGVVGLSPARHTSAGAGTAITIDFDQPVRRTSVTPATWRVFGRATGTAAGSFTFSPDQRSVTFTPAQPFSAGELVTVTLSHDIRAASGRPLRSAGYTYQFMIAVAPSLRQFSQIASMSNRTMNQQTRIYGAAATDLNGDRYIDLATVNEVSADVRVFLSLADGSGLYAPFLSPEPIGVEASPNDQADFDGDGNTDMCIGASSSSSIWILLGNGDGTFAAGQEVLVGGEPHGVVALDVDGDGDPDIVGANSQNDNLALLLNDGNGNFGGPSAFEAGVDGEYGLAVGDMDSDGISDLIVAGRDGEHAIVLLGQGDGTFTAAGPPQSTLGLTWVINVGDVDGDTHLDATTANSFSANGAVLRGLGDGTFAAAVGTGIGFHCVSTDLGDLDGDGDLDWVLSSFGGGFWRVFVNDGSGNFSFDQEISAPSHPSCAILYDNDNDGDLDLALTDEIADVVVLMENQ